MGQVIIYKQDSGRLAVVRPTADALAVYGIDAIARKDVPAGKPYKVMDAADLPADRSERDAWTVDEADLTDGLGGPSSEFDVPADGEGAAA